MKNIDAKFRAAWEVFARTCAAAVAPEATFQAWFAHYLLSQFGIDRAAPGPIFKHALLAQPGRAWCPAGGIKLDVVVQASRSFAASREGMTGAGCGRAR